MRKTIFILTVALILAFAFSCELPGPLPPPITPEEDSPEGLSAYRAYVFFQLSTGDNGNLYSVSANRDSGLNREGMAPDDGDYWLLTFDSVYGKMYADGTWERNVHSDSYGTFTSLNLIWSQDADSYDAVRTADANGGSEYDEIYSMTVASGNGGLFGYAGETLWVIIYTLKAENNPERCFLINASTGTFVKRF